MNCRTFRRRALEIWPASAPKTLAPELDAHRRGCPRCGAAWSADQELLQQLGRLRHEMVTVDVRGSVLARLRDEPPPALAVRPAARINTLPIVAAVLAITFLVWWTFPGPELTSGWRLVAEQAPAWIAWSFERLVHATLWLGGLAGGLLLDAALLVPVWFKWMRRLEGALPGLIFVNGLMTLLLATAVATLLRRLPVPRRLL